MGERKDRMKGGGSKNRRGEGESKDQMKGGRAKGRIEWGRRESGRIK